MPRWLLITLALLAGLGLVIWLTPGGYDFAMDLLSRFSPRYARLPVHKASVLKGQKLAWRMLYAGHATFADQYGSLGGLVSGNFDGDSDQELLLVGGKQGQYFELDGAATPVNLHGDGFMMDISAWDFDADGIDDVIPDATFYSVTQNRGSHKGGLPPVPVDTPVFSLSGREIGRLPAVGLARPPLIRDFNGDGRADIVLPGLEGGGAGLAIFQAQGAKLGDFLLDRGMVIAACDSDGDGRSELVQLLAKRHGTLSFFSFPSGRKDVYDWPPLVLSCGAGDIDGDGREELICRSGFLNVSSGRFTAFETVAGKGTAQENEPATGFDAGPDVPLVLKLPPDSGSQVICTDGLMGTSLKIYDAGGRCIYQEDFGRTLFKTLGLKSSGRDYLVLQFEEQILIYP